MKAKRLLPLLFVGCVAQTMAQTFNEWRDPEVNEMNRAPMHTSYFAFGNEKEALMGDKTQQENYLSLNGLWKFNWVKDADMRPTDFYQKNFDDSKWGTMPVPGLWELNGYGDPIYINVGYAWREHFKNNPPEVPVKENHVGSYRRTVVVPDTWKGKQVFIHLGSVTSNVYLWVNGCFVGYSEDSKLEAEFDVTPYLKKGENLLAVKLFSGSGGFGLVWRKGCHYRPVRFIPSTKFKPMNMANFEYKKGTVLDFSSLLDHAPAGKFGPVRVEREEFVFADGHKARFLLCHIFHPTFCLLFLEWQNVSVIQAFCCAEHTAAFPDLSAVSNRTQGVCFQNLLQNASQRLDICLAYI